MRGGCGWTLYHPHHYPRPYKHITHSSSCAAELVVITHWRDITELQYLKIRVHRAEFLCRTVSNFVDMMKLLLTKVSSLFTGVNGCRTQHDVNLHIRSAAFITATHRGHSVFVTGGKGREGTRGGHFRQASHVQPLSLSLQKRKLRSCPCCRKNDSTLYQLL